MAAAHRRSLGRPQTRHRTFGAAATGNPPAMDGRRLEMDVERELRRARRLREQAAARVAIARLAPRRCRQVIEAIRRDSAAEAPPVAGHGPSDPAARDSR
jgi:hypothetical protein